MAFSVPMIRQCSPRLFQQCNLSHRHSNIYTPFLRTFRSPNNSNTTKNWTITPTQASESSHISKPSLVKPICFTATVIVSSFVGASIWQYENMRLRAIQWRQGAEHWLGQHFPKRGEFRQRMHLWWQSFSEGQQLVISIIAANAIVFLLWKIPVLTPFMTRYFCSNPFAKAVCWPMLLSTFSHYSFWHFGINMYVLFSFASGIGALMGKEQFLAFYISAGAVSSLASHLHKVFLNRPTFSLGASGCLMGVLGIFCTHYPEAKLGIVFLPMFSFTADVALKAIIALDTAGLVLGWKVFDHAAHLGGVLFGILYSVWGRQILWDKREPIMSAWAAIREEGNSKD